MKKIFTFIIAWALLIQLKAQTTLPTSWNFSNPTISFPPSGWTLGLGTNGNLTYAFGIGDALSARLDATGEYVLINFTDKPGPLSYYLSPQNAGAGWAGQFDIQESANGTSWSTVRSITSKATTTTTFTDKYIDNLAASTRFVRFYYTTKLPGGVSGVPGGNMGLDSVLIQSAPAPVTPVINIKRNTTSIANGSTIITGNASATPIIIENLGTSQTLRIDSIKFSGAAASDFNVGGLPITVASGNNSTLSIGFSPSQSGSRLAKMYVYSNDVDKPIFIVNLYGVGGSFANEPTAQPVNLNFTNITSFGFTGNFSSTGINSEHYIVLKKRNALITEVPTDGVSYKKGDYIGNAQVELICDSGIAFVPTYIFANSTYNYAVFSFNGPSTFENYFITSPLKNSVSTNGKNIGTYYTNIDPLKSDFITKLNQKINPHDTIYYSNYISRLVNPWLARDTSGGMRVVTCVYTGDQYVYNEPFLWYNGSNGGILTREHTYAQSWMPSNLGNPDWPNAAGTSKELPEYNDLHHLFPAHQLNANAKRSNYPFGEVVVPTYTAPTGFGMVGTDSASKTAYEPRPEHKGDLARALFYMAVCYNGINGKNWSIPSAQNLAILKQWNIQDPPDNFEIARHEFIASQQHNRNPFIDHPEWADRINFSNMTYIPADTTTVKHPSIFILNPIATTIWEKGTNVKINWTSTDIDSVFIFFTSDAFKTLEQIGGAVFAKSDSINFIYNQSLKSSKAAIIIVDPISSKADTSEIFSIVKSSSLANIQTDLNIEVFPNPIKDEKLVIRSNNKFDTYNFSILDLLGKTYFTGSFVSETCIQLNSFTSGVYFIKISNENQSKLIKLIKE